MIEICPCFTCRGIFVKIMESFVEWEFQIGPGPDRELLIAKLYQYGFNGFQETDYAVLAYCSKSIYDERLFSLKDELNRHYRLSEHFIGNENWNMPWESTFKNVEIDHFLRIRSCREPFRTGFLHNLVIDPEMSFGSGVHPTTQMMVQLMKTVDFKGKSVLDFGCGTGILSLLSEQLGASRVLGIDNDPNCIKNARKHIKLNHAIRTEIAENDRVDDIDESFNIILCNMNLNYLLEFLPKFYHLKPDLLLLSGFLSEDIAKLRAHMMIVKMREIELLRSEDWAALKIVRHSL